MDVRSFILGVLWLCGIAVGVALLGSQESAFALGFSAGVALCRIIYSDMLTPG